MVDQFFLNRNVVDVEAANVGIGANRWVSIPSDQASEKKARAVMEENRFDVLPIEPESGPVDSYYVTEEWGNFSSVGRQTIGYEDTLPFRRSIRSAVKELSGKSRNFLFLTRDQEVVGLLTVSNLNCRAVRVYLFGLIAEMEKGLAKVVRFGLDQGHFGEEYVTGKMRGHLEGQYRKAKEEGVDESITSYLHLSDLKEIICEHDLYSMLGYKEGERFEVEFESVRNFRHTIAHPVRSLKGTDGSPSSMWNNIEICERALFRLHNSSSSIQM
jgi:hypothetical protein